VTRKQKLAAAAAGAVMLLGAGAAALLAQRLRHERSAADTWSELALPGDAAVLFDPVMVEHLPAPARRWFLHAIAPGTPLASAALLLMHGTILLKQGGTPLPMQAEQVLAPPHGFVWKARVGSGALRMRGFDRCAGTGSEMRWWLYGLVPIVHVDGADVARSAAGRLAGEGTLLPESLLPGRGAVWEAVDDDIARATLHVRGEPVSFTLDVAPDGRLRRVEIRRWNGDPANGRVGYLPFLVEFEGERTWSGHTLPARLTAGWSPDGTFRPFFQALLDDVAFR
jgi:hypothetical protein